MVLTSHKGRTKLVSFFVLPKILRDSIHICSNTILSGDFQNIDECLLSGLGVFKSIGTRKE